MSSFSQLTILGNVTADPEVGQLPDGKTETSRFSVAVNRKRGENEDVTFYRTNFIGNLAKVANQYLAKGRPVLVVGEPRLSQYTKNDGSPGASIEVRGTQLQLIGSKGDGPAATAPSKGTADDGEDNIPF